MYTLWMVGLLELAMVKGGRVGILTINAPFVTIYLLLWLCAHKFHGIVPHLFGI